MDRDRLEAAILARGRALFAAIGAETPSIFDKSWWAGKVMDWSMRHEHFKVQLFRFIDVLPYLTTAPALRRHVDEYFAREPKLPGMLKWGFKAAAIGGRFAKDLLAKSIRRNVEKTAGQFIIGGTVRQAVANLGKLRRRGFAFTLDVLGETTVSEAEADRYARSYLRLLDGLERAQSGWPALGSGGDLDWGHAPRINLSVKPSALYSQADPANLEGSVGRILERLRPICRRVAGAGGFLCIDVESRKYKAITLELYRRLRGDREFRDYPHLGLAFQTYLTEADRDLDALLDWSRRRGLPISLRLVKGAYWDQEVLLARQRSQPAGVYTVKAETDAAFERAAEKILRSHEHCHLACGSHNVRSVSAVMELARALRVPEERYEFQVLYGMAEPFRKALLKTAGRVRLYCPQGELLPGMAYLIRRLMENTSNESFLRQTFAEGLDPDRLLANPAAALRREPAEAARPPAAEGEPVADFCLAEVRQGFRDALAEARRQLGRTRPLFIDGRDVHTDNLLDSVNPARPDEVVGRVCQAGPGEIDTALAAAEGALPAWRDTPPRERADCLRQAAEIARRRIYELAAWQVLEAGKQWGHAHADVAEAIDFLGYHAREMDRLGDRPGEQGEHPRRPQGVAAVIAPWCSPLAIGCGMCSAAIVAGNCVLYKPSSRTPVVGRMLAELFREAGLPAGVLSFVPGRGSAVGDALVDDPRVGLVAFAGSRQVGERIIERARRTGPDQPPAKQVIAESGGPNTAILDDDADLDEAVPEVIASAFGCQGQKGSACSRVIVLDGIYERFVERLVEAARSVRIGPAEDPANTVGPVISRSAQQRGLESVELARREGTVLYAGDVPDEGFYVPLTVVAGIGPEHRLAREEIFAPVLTILRAKDLDQAIQWVNATRFARAATVFSRSPRRLQRCRRELRVANLHLDRGRTGALVGLPPAARSRTSGIGPRAGRGDYLLRFLDPRAVPENTSRRGVGAGTED